MAEPGAKREQPSARKFMAKSASVIVREVCRQLGVKETEIRRKRSESRDERAVAMEMLYRHGQLSQARIGKELGGLDYATVSRERKRLREKVQEDRKFGAALKDIEESLHHK